MDDQSQTWMPFWEEAEKYLTTARRGLTRPQIFTETILYNLVALAIEKCCMAFLMAHHRLPNGHTLNDLIEAAGEIVEFDERLINKVQYYDQQQQICFLATYNRNVCSMEDIKDFITVAEEIHSLFESSWPSQEICSRIRNFGV